MYHHDDVNFESPLATFTRQYASTENRQAQAWKGWIDVLERQYQPTEFTQALSKLDYEFFGCDIVFLASAWGGPKFIEAVSPYVAWHQLVRNENMAESVETLNPHKNNLDFSQEPSFWLWYYGCNHDHPKTQFDDVEYCVDKLLRIGALSMEHKLPSYSFGHDITLRTMLVAWDIEMESVRVKNILTQSPIPDDEAADLVVAYCANGAQSTSSLKSEDENILFKLVYEIDYRTPYPLSDHFKSVLNTQADYLPLGVVAVGLMMRVYNSGRDILDRIIVKHPEIFEQHLEIFYNIALSEGLMSRDREQITDHIFRDHTEFDIRPTLGVLLRKSLENATSNMHSNKTDSREVIYLRKMLEMCAKNVNLDGIFTEQDTTAMLQGVFNVFSETKRHDSNIELKHIDSWWTEPSGWQKCLTWFDPAVRERVNCMIQPIIEAASTLQNQAGKSRYNQDDSPTQAAHLTLKLFDAQRWNETTRKLKM